MLSMVSKGPDMITEVPTMLPLLPEGPAMMSEGLYHNMVTECLTMCSNP